MPAPALKDLLARIRSGAAPASPASSKAKPKAKTKAAAPKAKPAPPALPASSGKPIFGGLAERLKAAEKPAEKPAPAPPAPRAPASSGKPKFAGLAERFKAAAKAPPAAAEPSVGPPRFAGIAERLKAAQAAAAPAKPTAPPKPTEPFVALGVVGNQVVHPHLDTRAQWEEEERNGRIVRTKIDTGRVTGAPDTDVWTFVFVTPDAGGPERKVPIASLRVARADAARFLAEAKARVKDAPPTLRRPAPLSLAPTGGSSHKVAETILEHLGGRKFLQMTGAKDVLTTATGLQFHLPSTPHFVRQGINAVNIDLNPNDTYRMRFTKVGRAPSFEVTEIATIDGVFAGDLRRDFAAATGLDTSLGTAGRERPAGHAAPEARPTPVPESGAIAGSAAIRKIAEMLQAYGLGHDQTLAIKIHADGHTVENVKGWLERGSDLAARKYGAGFSVEAAADRAGRGDAYRAEKKATEGFKERSDEAASRHTLAKRIVDSLQTSPKTEEELARELGVDIRQIRATATGLLEEERLAAMGIQARVRPAPVPDLPPEAPVPSKRGAPAQPRPTPKRGIPGAGGTATVKLTDGTTKSVPVLGRDRDLFVHLEPGSKDSKEGQFTLTHEGTGLRVGKKFQTVEDAMAYAMDLNSPPLRTILDEIVGGDHARGRELNQALKAGEPDRLERYRNRPFVPVALSANPVDLEAEEYTDNATPEEHQKRAARRTANIEAVTVAAHLLKTHENPTDQDLRVMGAYSGWGGLGGGASEPRILEKIKPLWPEGFPFPEKRGLAYEYYTPAKVAAEVARVLKPLLPALAEAGEGTIHALEPSAGIGRFVRAMQTPVPGFEPVEWHAVEYSAVSAALLRAMRPELDLYEGPFERWVMQNEDEYRGKLRLVISNPPYGAKNIRGAATVEDTNPTYRKYTEASDYFLRRGLDLLAKDGIGVYLIPTGFLTGTGKADMALRKEVLLRQHLMCAYRMPSKLFPGALVTVDLLFFRSRGGVLESIDPADEAILAGDYYRNFPKNILGIVKEGGGRYSSPDKPSGYEVVGEFTGLPDFRERDICTSCVHTPIVMAPPPKLKRSDAALLKGAHPRLAAASSLGLRLGKFLTELAAQDSEMPALAWEELHRGLLDWSAEFGAPSSDADLTRLAREDGDVGAQKFLTGFLKRKTELIPSLNVKPVYTPRFTGKADDPVARAEFVYRQHRSLLRSDVGDALPRLFAAGWAEDEPGQIVPPEVYYTGNLWPKFDRAKARADAGDKQGAVQAERLMEQIKPAMFDDIGGVSPQQGWVPLELVQGWVSSISKSGAIDLEWKDGLLQVSGKSYEELEGGWSNDVENVLGWINHDRTLFSPQKKYKNAVEKENIDDARLRQAHEWEQAFRAYVAADEGRRQLLEQTYQRLFQGYKQPKYSVDPLTLARWGSIVKLRPHQNAGARRVLANRGGIVAFDVGVGKTYTGCAILAAARQEGWAKRPVILVPNSILWNWVAEIKKALPDYRVGIIGTKRKIVASGPKKGYQTSETDTENERAEKWTQFQAGQYDVMLVTYSSFPRTKMSDDSIIEYVNATAGIEREIALRKRNAGRSKARVEAAEAKGKAPKHGLSERQEAILEEGTAAWVAEKLELPKSWKYDPGISWEEIGCDLLIVDEAQNFKTLNKPEPREHGVPKFMGSAGEGSNRSWQLDFRSMTVRKKSGGAGIVLLSATPAKNSPLEFFNLIQYVDHDAFQRMGIMGPEQFIDRYCKLESRDIVTADGDIESASACVGFMNLHELRDIVFRYGEFVTGEDVERFGSQARYETWRELMDHHGATADEIARVWGWGLADVKKGLETARGKVNEENPDSATEPVLTAEPPRAKPNERRASLAAKRLPTGNRTWLDVLTATCMRLSVPLVIGLDDGLKLPVPQVVRVEVEENREQERKRLDYKQRLEDALENPGGAEPGAMLGILASLSLVAIHPALDERHTEIKTNPETKEKREVKVPDWTWLTAGGIAQPSSPKFEAVKTHIGKNPGCGHIVFVENIAAHVWLKMVLSEIMPADRIAILNADTNNPLKSAQSRQDIARDFNGTPEVPGTDGSLGEAEILPKYDVVIANQVAYEGINLQTRTCAVHHVDLPWDPATLQQRNGRAWRQGNKFLAVQILYYEMRCYPDGMKHKLIEGKAGWMADLIAGQKRDTNNPAAQMDVGPEEALGMIACDPAAVKQRFDEIKAKRLEENRAKLAEGASQTLRGAVSRYQRALYLDTKKNTVEAARLRSEADQRLADLTHVDPLAWPWSSWAQEAKRGVQMLVPPAGGAPVYETLQVAIPDQWDPKVKNYIEFGKSREGKQIAFRKAGQVTWGVKNLQDIIDLKLVPEYRTGNWPEDDDEKIVEAMREEIRAFDRGPYAINSAWTNLGWIEAPNAFVERVWRRYGEKITDAFKSAVGIGHWQDQLQPPVVRNGILEVGVKRKFDEMIPPTDRGYETFLAMAPTSDVRFDALERAAKFWWGRGIPRETLAAATPEQKAASALVAKLRVEQEKKDREEAEREEKARRERERLEAEAQAKRREEERAARVEAERAARAGATARRDEEEAALLARDRYATIILESRLTSDPEIRRQLQALGGSTAGKNYDTGQWRWRIPLLRAAEARRLLKMD